MKSQVNIDDNSSSTLKVDKIRIEIKNKSNIIINEISAKEKIYSKRCATYKNR